MLEAIARLPLAGCLGLAATTPAAAAAQDDLLDEAKDLFSASAITDAASALADEAEDGVLIKDLLGKELKGENGDTLGTVEDFVVIPGGRLIAAMVETEAGTRLAVPFQAVKIAGAAKDAGLELPIAASELEDMDELRSLADSLSDWAAGAAQSRSSASRAIACCSGVASRWCFAFHSS